MLGGRVRAGLTVSLVVLLTLCVGAGVGAASGRPAGHRRRGTGRWWRGRAVGWRCRRASRCGPGTRRWSSSWRGGPRLTRADGGCSSPWGGTRYGFDAACRAHDLGYDLLRDAAATGRPYAGSARARVDARFWHDLGAGLRARPRVPRAGRRLRGRGDAQLRLRGVLGRPRRGRCTACSCRSAARWRCWSAGSCSAGTGAGRAPLPSRSCWARRRPRPRGSRRCCPAPPAASCW